MIYVVEVIGWTGVVAYVAAYGLLSAGVIKANRYAYHAMNAIGAVALVIYSNAASDVPNVVVNAIWLFIAGISILKMLRKRRSYVASSRS
jgi:uncharacterized membrane protein YfbV (UPF0208 family)